MNIIRMKPALDLRTVTDARNILRRRRIEHDVPEIDRAKLDRMRVVRLNVQMEAPNA